MINESIFKFIKPSDIGYFKDQISQSKVINCCSKILDRQTSLLKIRTSSSEKKNFYFFIYLLLFNLFSIKKIEIVYLFYEK